MKRKTIFNTLILTLMVFSSLCVANLSPHLQAQATDIITVTQASSVSQMTGTNTKYKDGKGNYYEGEVKDGSNEALTYATFSNGRGYGNNNYKIGDTLYFKYEPIVWQVLDYTSNYSLVVSNNALAAIRFQPTYSGAYTTANGGDGTTTKANNYKYSNIRYWLNGYTQTNQKSNATDGFGDSFLDTAFTSSEQSQIMATSGLGILQDGGGQTSYVAGTFNQSSPTSESADKIFLLSRADIVKSSYYTSSSAASTLRVKSSTDFIVRMLGVDVSTARAWTLRTQGTDDGGITGGPTHRIVSSDGADSESTGMQTAYNIVPAMYLNTSGLTFYSDANCTTTTSAAAKTYIKFGSYPQTIADCTTTINIPAAGVSINTAGIVLSSSILIGLFVWMGFIAKSAIKSRKRK